MPQVGDLIYDGRRVWVVSAVYETNVAVRYPEDQSRLLERAFMQKNDIARRTIYRQAHPEVSEALIPRGR